MLDQGAVNQAFGDWIEALAGGASDIDERVWLDEMVDVRAWLDEIPPDRAD
jgi:hypothetical protein